MDEDTYENCKPKLINDSHIFINEKKWRNFYLYGKGTWMSILAGISVPMVSSRLNPLSNTYQLVQTCGILSFPKNAKFSFGLSCTKDWIPWKNAKPDSHPSILAPIGVYYADRTTKPRIIFSCTTPSPSLFGTSSTILVWISPHWTPSLSLYSGLSILLIHLLSP